MLAKVKNFINKYLYNNKTIETNNIIIETISYCNVRCVWCPMQNFKKHKIGRMTLESFEKIIKTNKDYLIENYNGVEPYFRGEPLLHPQFWDLCEVLRKNGINNGGINSNLSMKIDYQKFLDYELNVLVNLGGITKEIHESVMKQSNFDLVISNLKMLYKYGAKVSVKMNPTKINYHQQKDLPDFIESLGGKRDSILSYKTCYPIPFEATIQELNYFFEQIVSSEINDLLRFTYNVSDPYYAIKTKTPGCNFLMDVIFFDGQFSICCHDQLQKVNVGNVFDTPIEKIKSSDSYKEAVAIAKKCGYDFCKECN